MEKNEKKETLKKNGPLYTYFIFLFLVIVMMVFSFYFWLALNNSHIPPLSFVSEREETETIEEGHMAYKNYSANFQFIYPENWAVAEGHNSVVVSSDKEYPQNYIEAKDPTMKDTDIYIQIHFSNQTVDISREIPNYTKASWSNITINGVEARKISYVGTDKFAEIIPNFLMGDFYFAIIVDSMDSNEVLISEYNKLIDFFGAIEENK